MKWKTFWQIVLLMIIAGAIIYIISPKYYFKTPIKGNKITGKVMGLDEQWSLFGKTDIKKGFERLAPENYNK